MVMIRPHARSFVPSKDDIKTACAEVRQAKKIGAVNFLTGFLSADHKLNKDALKAIRDAAGECNLHSHLAWELTDNPEKAIEVLIALGFKSLRTGGKSAGSDAFGGNVANATNNIIKIKNFANNRIEILLAGGITIDNVQDIILRTGITDIHCGRGARTPADAQSPVDQEKVNAIREAQLNAIGALNKKLKI
jgi:copper homeostasis protein